MTDDKKPCNAATSPFHESASAHDPVDNAHAPSLCALVNDLDGVWDWCLNTGHVRYNARWAHMLDYTQDDIKSTIDAWFSQLHPEDKVETLAALHAHLRGETPFFEHQYRMRIRSGAFKWILTRARVLTRDPNGNPLRVMGVNTDLTRHKHEEERNRQSRASLTLVQRIASIGSWNWNLDTDELGWSEETYRLLGLSPDNTSPHFDMFLKIVHPDDRQLVRDTVDQAQKQGRTFSVEHRIVTPAGDVRHVVGQGMVRRDAHGKAVFLFGTIQDITERKMSEEALRASEERFRAMSNACFDALIMIDAEDKILFWSPAAARMFGYTAPEVIGQRLHSLISTPGDKEKADEGMRRFAETGEGPVVGSLQEMTAVHKNGTIFPVERSVASFTSNGQWFAVGMLRDVTQRKETERKLTLLATTDSLTGLFNRRCFLEKASRACKEAARYNSALSLVMLDVDHFKNVNDTYGHAAGDMVLKSLAQLLRSQVRDVDIVGRVGGEEFALAMPQTPLDAGRLMAERLRTAVQETAIDIQGDAPVHVTVSLGLTCLRDKSDTLASLLKRADQAMYKAKNTGRNNVQTL